MKHKPCPWKLVFITLFLTLLIINILYLPFCFNFIGQEEVNKTKLGRTKFFYSQHNNLSTLADHINLSMNTITDWKTSTDLLARGIALGKADVTDYDDLILYQRMNDDWVGVLSSKRSAEISNYSSEIIDESVKWALDYAPMFNYYSLPLTKSNSYFNLWSQTVLNGYRYARELNHSREKWNANSALAALKHCRFTFGRAFYQCNPDTNSILNLHGTRWMSTANLASCFMILYEQTGKSEALDLALQEWQDLNSYYWSETKGGYEYSRNWKTWEWSTIEVVFSYEKLRELRNGLTNWDRVYTDLQNRYLNKSWNSPLWDFNAQVVLHSEYSSQKRLHGTLDAWMLLHTYFGKFFPANQNKMRGMLEGNDKQEAWRGLLSSEAQLYNPNNYRFKIDSNSVNDSDYGTAEGCITLFLLGISPQKGSGLIIPKRSEGYSGEPFPTDTFRFYYNNQQIIIPVYGDSDLKFLFGTTYPNYVFPKNGLYRITFTSDWNSIINVELIKKIHVNYPREEMSEAILNYNTVFQLSFLLFIGISTIALILFVTKGIERSLEE